MKPKNKSGKRYLTEELCRTWPPGTVANLEYDDFNSGKFVFLLTRTYEDSMGFRAVGMADYGNGEAWEMELYSFNRHRGGDKTPIMCSGSGAERCFIKGSVTLGTPSAETKGVQDLEKQVNADLEAAVRKPPVHITVHPGGRITVVHPE